MNNEVRNPCCCCMSNRTGALTVGILSLVGSILSIVGFVIPLAIGVQEVSTNQDESAPGTDESTENKSKTIRTVFLVVYTVVMFVNLVVSSLLVHGIRKQNAKLVLPWLVTTILMFLLLLTLGVVAVVMSSPRVAVGFLFELLLPAAFQIWFFSIVYYYRQALQRGGDGRDITEKC